ncbi:MAG: hypothetical protein BWY71_02288 [Planctomycetes bacterium ADurb.Bin412]|nr:MAG: hypothetical protein BWY71_02288 [Planctomycetes bacterium ADurb.Bin412]
MHLIGIAFRCCSNGPAAVEGQPQIETVGMALMNDRIKFTIALQQGQCPAHGFQVIPPAAAGTGVDHHARMTPLKFIPIGQITFNIADFGDSLPVLSIVISPEGQRINVIILTIQIDFLFGDDFAHLVGNPSHRFRLIQPK